MVEHRKPRDRGCNKDRYTTAMAEIAGILVVDKPLGWSSMAVVRRVRRAAGRAKTGHAGTLDPLATGVLICCVGKATRCVEHLMGLPKVYEAGIDLSAFTATDDAEAPPEPVPIDRPPTRADIDCVLTTFAGVIQQRPPIYSAVHVEGKRAYKLARRGLAIELPPRPVRIDSIEVLSFDWPLLTIRVTCGRGTYIRSLARDIGSALRTGGYLRSLRRTAIGQYDLSMAVSAARLEQPITQDDLMPGPAGSAQTS